MVGKLLSEGAGPEYTEMAARRILSWKDREGHSPVTHLAARNKNRL